jgi:threonine synthase
MAVMEERVSPRGAPCLTTEIWPVELDLVRYLSTRGERDHERPGFGDILLAGLAGDGGLYLPERYPQVDSATLADWRQTLSQDGYAALAAKVIGLFVDDIPSDDLRTLCQRAYHEKVFSSPEIVPVSELGNGIWLSHLSTGPTAAFKDLAMQLLGQLFEYQLARTGTELNILGATSGDTGSAAEYSMQGLSLIHISEPTRPY